MLNTIIFSKKRPMQLDALLRSYRYFFCQAYISNTTIIYQDDNDSNIIEGYEKCKNYHDNFTFVDENSAGGFKKALLSAFDVRHEYSMFLVDDIIFKGNFGMDDGWDFKGSNVLAHSLRLYPGINYCYPTNEVVNAPSSCKWNWKNMKGDWGYPMSCDGHIFQTHILQQICKVLNYNNPNSLEGAMAQMAGSGQLDNFPLLTCYEKESKLINIPANRVQETCQNRVGNIISPEELNQQFLNDKIVDWRKFEGLQNKAPHEEHPFELIDLI